MSNEPLPEPGSDALPVTRRPALFYVWFDDTPHKLTTVKLDEAISAYVARFTMQPSHVLVNSADVIGRSDVIVQSGRTVQPNTFWLSSDTAVAPPTA